MERVKESIIYYFGIITALFFGLNWLMDNDSFWHVKYGNLLLNNLWFSRIDNWSFLSNGLEWYYPGWLPEYLFALFAKLNNVAFEGVFLLMTVFMVIMLIGYFLVIKTKSIHPLFAVVLVIFTSQMFFQFWTIRSLVFTKILLIYTLFIFEYFVRQGKKTGIILLFIINVLWINSHADFPLLFLVQGFYLVIFCIENITRNKALILKELFQDNKIRILIAIIISSFFIIFYTPYGIGTIGKIVDFFKSTALTDILTEWKAVSITNPSFTPFILTFIFYIAILIDNIRLKKVDINDIPYICLQIVLFGMTMQSRRFIHYYATFYPLSISLLLSKAKLNEYMDEFVRKVGTKLLYSLLIIFACSLSVMFYFKTVVPNTTQLFYTKYNYYLTPYDALVYLEKEHITLTGNVFNSYNNGAFVSYYYPSTKIAIDSRAGVYSRDTFELWKRIVKSQEPYSKWFELWNIKYIWLDNNQNWEIIPVLRKDNAWQLIYESDTSIIFMQK